MRSPTVPINDLSRLPQELAGACSDAVQRAVSSRWYVLGSETDRFEEGWGQYIGRPHVVSCANGTDALELMLRACGVGAGDEVILAPNAGFYGTTACMAVGAFPVYADIDECSPNLATAAAESALSDRTKVILVTHLYGIPADVAGLQRLCQRRGLILLEDCAQAHGATALDQDGVRRHVGCFGLAASFSFYPSKNLGAFGDAGAVVTSDPAIDSRLRQLKQYGWSDRYMSVLPHGRNSRMDECQAAVLNVMLPFLEARNRRRCAIVKAYRDVTNGFVYDGAADGAVSHLAVVKVPNRDRAIQVFHGYGIMTAIHYPLLDPDQPCMDAVPHRVADDLKHANTSVESIITLPCFPEMQDDEIARVCDVLKQIGIEE